MKREMTPFEVADYLATIKAQAPRASKAAKPKKMGRPKGSRNRRKPHPELPPGPRTVRLRARHTINGVAYGPGDTTVSAELAQHLEEADGRAVAYDDHWRDERAFMIGPRVGSGHTKRQVHPSFFDQPDLIAAEAAVASRGDAASTKKDDQGNLEWAGP